MYKGQRESGIDILRIISMLGIVVLHVYNQGGVIVASRENLGMRIISETIIIVCYCSVNIFAMMTGYLYCGRKSVNNKNIINLIVTTIFWSVLCTTFFLLIKPDVFHGLKDIICSFFPPIGGRFWYITAYVLLFFMIPFLNQVVDLFDKKLLEQMLLTAFVLLSIIPTLGFTDFFRTQNGYSPFWLMFCYLIGAYIKKYGFLNGLSDKIVNKKNAVLLLIINVGIILLSWEGIAFVTKRILGVVKGTAHFAGYISPFTVLNAILFIYLFSGIYIENEKKVRLLSGISAVAFDVYTVHGQLVLYDYYMKDAFVWIAELPIYFYVLAVILVPIVIYIVCGVCGLIRMKLFDGAKYIKGLLCQKLRKF